MKKYFILAAAALAFAACTNDEILPQAEVQQTVDDGAVRFDAYLNRATTRAGQAGTIDNAALRTSTSAADVSNGFGVFAFYTDNSDYTQYAVPNFMYNQKVYYNTGVWEYSPVKYWPNEFGTTAVSDDVDKVTFFAYAPYVQVNPTNGVPTAPQDKEANITQLTKNTATGDPIIKYVVDTDPKTSVDLLWGVVPTSTGYEPVSGTTAAPTLQAGMPYIDLVKAQVASRVSFNFKHALAKLNVQIDYDKDVENPHTGSPADVHTGTITDTQTRIFVRSVTFTGFSLKGALNLNNTNANEPLWYDYDGSKEITASAVTFYDGRKDGKEATSNGEQKSEKPATLNPNLIQNESCYDAGAFAGTPGVTNEAANLFNNTKPSGTASDPIFVIPTNDEMTVTIVYDVETIDPNLPTSLADGVTHGSSVENRIIKESVFGAINPGKFYTLKLHLGMTSVKFDAEVTEWDTDKQDVDLPHNSRSIYITPATSDIVAAGGDVTLAAKDGNGTSVVLTSGATLDHQYKISNSVTTDPSTDVTANLAESKVSVAANTTVYNIDHYLKFSKVDGGLTYPSNIVTIHQAAHVLGLSATGADGSPTITLSSTATSFDGSEITSISIKKDGVDVPKVTAPATSGKFSIDAKVITLGTNAASGEKYVITVKAGDAAEETFTLTIL